MIERIPSKQIGKWMGREQYGVLPNSRYLPKHYPWMIVDSGGRSVAFVHDELTAHKWAAELEARGCIDVLGG